MRTLIIITGLITGLLLQGCALPLIRGTVFKETKMVVALRDNIPMYSHTSRGVGDSIGVMNVKRGDTIRTMAHMMYGNWHLQCLNGTDSVWVKNGDVRTLAVYDATQLGLFSKVKVPKSKADDAWSRAVVWVNKNSDMKIQTSSDNLVDTYNPITPGNYGFTATRMTIGDTCTIELDCKYKPYQYTYGNDCFAYVRAGLYFILTGIDESYFWYK
jgi:hypothetical protein